MNWAPDLEAGEYVATTPRGECIVSKDGGFRRYRPELVHSLGATYRVTRCEAWIEGRWEGFASVDQVSKPRRDAGERSG